MPVKAKTMQDMSKEKLWMNRLCGELLEHVIESRSELMLHLQ